ncbi:MAG: AgmX/PglI C-terminal domain-containing protein [Bdellovibrionales bacterium]|nr:AgmX/PglI C-terminal domain-containing protein [Bdellovibrionales bacterium]
MKPPVLLRIYQQGQLVSIKQFLENQIVIGHNADVQLDLDSDEISPLHCIIEERDSGYYLTDLGSANGTILNGEKILDEKLESGTRFDVGPYSIEFYVGVPKPTAPPPPVNEKPKVEEPKITPTPTKQQQTVAQSGSETVEQKEEKIPTVESKAEKEASSETKEAPQAPVPPPVAPPETSPEERDSKSSNAEPSTEEDLAVEEEIQVEDDLPVEPVVNHTVTREIEMPTEMTITKDIPTLEANEGEFSYPYRKKNTFAPKSEIKDLKQVIKPGKGTSVEVIVAWKERVIDTYQYNDKRTVYVGSDAKNDIVLPVLGTKLKKYPLIHIGPAISVNFLPEMGGAVIKENKQYDLSQLILENKIPKKKSGYMLNLAQGEMLYLSFGNGELGIFIRYAPQVTKPLAAPLLDLSTTQMTNLIFSGVMLAIFALYMVVYSPAYIEEVKVEEPIRKAQVTFKPPRPPQQKAKIEKNPVVTKSEIKAPVKKDKTKQPKAKDPGKANEIAKRAKKPKKSPKVSTVRSGGSKKTSKVKGSRAKAKKKKTDVSKLGLFTALGRGNNNSKDTNFDGEGGGLIGEAKGVKGRTGFDRNRKGNQWGDNLKDTGASGSGSSTIGIAGVGTSGGSGSGTTGSGSGGVGIKSKVDIALGGSDEEFIGSIDIDAIRRVIDSAKNSFRYCYEKELAKNSGLYGKISLQWEIVSGGRVRKASVAEDTMGSKAVSSCLVARLRALEFPEPPPNQIAEVKFPFVFRAQ